ncbi:MAG: response regulator [Desulfamplus sp.]|nr:response regulator [Desulfamplus sp.]
MGNYISYFRDSIKNLDIKKAKDLLLDLHLESDKTKVAILDELAMVSDSDAWILLDFVIRLETKYYKSFNNDNHNKLIQLITDRAHLNFDFALIFYKACDRKRLLKASPLLKYILTNCTDREILFETINIIGEEKIESLVPAVAEFLYYDDATLKDQSVKTLAKIGSPEVYKIFFDISKTVKNDQNIIDALASFKIPSIEPSPQVTSAPILKAQPTQISTPPPSTPPPQAQAKQKTESKQENDGITLYMQMFASKAIEQRFEAISYFLNPDLDLKSNPQYLKQITLNLKSNDHDLVLNSLRLIANRAASDEILSDEILPDIYSFLNKKQSDQSLEHQAFETLCSFDKFSFTELMMGAIEKNAIHVRISAIKALDKNYNDPVYAKVKNRIETGREHGQKLVHTIIDAQAKNLINYLLVSDTFVDMASTYLAKDATPSALNSYLNILTNRGLKSTAKKIEFKADMGNKLQNKLRAMVISSSDTVQKIYEKLLLKNGYISIGFDSPEEAFEPISADKPDLIVSDLFLKDMTALDFAREIREFYSKNDLPFLISTRQKDFLDLNLTDKYLDCGINGVFRFPEIVKGINELIK